MRFTTQATRRLHPASDCLAAIGFAISRCPRAAGRDGTAWGCFAARKPGDGADGVRADPRRRRPHLARPVELVLARAHGRQPGPLVEHDDRRAAPAAAP